MVQVKLFEVFLKTRNNKPYSRIPYFLMAGEAMARKVAKNTW